MAKKSEVLQGTLDLMGPENASRLGTSAWFWDRPAHRAAQRKRAANE